MGAALEIAAVLVLGVGALFISRASRARHIAKFGPAPTGSRGATVAWFGACSAALAVLAWLSITAFGAVLVALLVFSRVAGFRARAWGPWQQFRDGAVYSALFSAPVILLAVWMTNG